MGRRGLKLAILLHLTATAAVWAQGADREAVVQALLERSRLLDDAHFTVPVSLWRQYIRDTSTDTPEGAPAPVSMVPGQAVYALTVPADGLPTLLATQRLRVFHPEKCANVPLFPADLAWEELTVDGQPAKLATSDGWVRFSPDDAGQFVIAAKVALKEGTAHGGRVRMKIPRTVRTLVRFESPGEWEAAVSGEGRRIRGSADAGTHGQIALTPRDSLKLTYRRPRVVGERPPRYQLRGAIAWNLDAGGQQVAADLNVAIVGGRTNQIELLLPGSAERARVTGPDVREARTGGGSTSVFLRGRIAGQTRLRVGYELPGARSDVQRLRPPRVRDGHWAGGTLVVTNTAGSSEVLPGSTTGLRELALLDVPASASAILAGPAMLAYEITSRGWAAEVEILDLGEFALRETIADLAHYEIVFREDGSAVGKATYEIRNRTQQFLRVRLPRGAVILIARVNEKSQPLTPAPAADDTYLLPLVRSKASVKGLVSFPVELVFVFRTEPLTAGGRAGIPLPTIDMPIAYAWCEAYVPTGMEVTQWTGPFKRVAEYSSETARADLAYGRSIAAEGYERDRASVGPALPEERPPALDAPSRGFFNVRKPLAKREPAAVTSPRPTVSHGLSTGLSQAVLAKNYYRAGKDFYEKGDFENATESFGNVVRLLPKSSEAENAKRLLANVKAVRGEAQLRSRAEKAAGAQVKRDVWALNVDLEARQQELIEQGEQAAREGRKEQAVAQFTAAEALSRKLLSQGASAKGQRAVMRPAARKLEEARKRQAQEAAQLRVRLSHLKGKKRYKEAIDVAQKLRIVDPDKPLAFGKEVVRLNLLAARQEAEGRQREALRREATKLKEQVRSLAVRHERFAEAKGTPEPEIAVAGKRVAVEPEEPADELAFADVGRLKEDVSKLRDTLSTYRSSLRKLADRRVAPKPQPTPAARPEPEKVTVTYDTVALGGLTVANGEDLQKVLKDMAVVYYDDGTRRDAAVTRRNGRITISQTPRGQIQVQEFFKKLKTTRGPQVELGANIAGQRAKGLVDQKVDPGRLPDQAAAIADEKNVQDFISRNYGWRTQRGRRADGGGAGGGGVAEGTSRVTAFGGSEQTLALGDQLVHHIRATMAPETWDDVDEDGDGQIEALAGDLVLNFGQKIQIGSINLDVAAPQANSLGVGFTAGNNGVNYAVVDEAQFRTLMQLDADNSADGRIAVPNTRRQDTIVGTDALLANGWVANASFAQDRRNTIDINGNAIVLPHEKYILVDNGGYLTAVRAGEMQHWTQEAPPIQFAEVPQDIEVPRVGRLVKFEKTLVKPTDRLGIWAEIVRLKD